MAWLNTVPEKRSESRADQFEEQPIPPIQHGLHLIDYLYEVGPCNSTGFGFVPVTWSDLAAWNHGYSLTGWELRTLRHLSEAYAKQANESVKPDCPPPWVEHQTPEARKAVASKIRNLFRS